MVIIVVSEDNIFAPFQMQIRRLITLTINQLPVVISQASIFLFVISILSYSAFEVLINFVGTKILLEQKQKLE